MNYVLSRQKNLASIGCNLSVLYRIYISISFIIVFYNLIVFNFLSKNFENISVELKLKNYMGGRLYITAEYPQSTDRIGRISDILKYFEESGMVPVVISDATNWSEFKTVLLKQSDMDKYMKIVPIKTNRKKLEVSAWLKRKNSLSHFLYNTTAAWALLFDDDCDFAPHNYFRLIDDLERKYETESEPIIFGQKVKSDRHETGVMTIGAGFIVSRKFAEIFLKTFEYEMENMYHPDDVHMTQLAEKYGNVPSCYYGKYTTEAMTPKVLKMLIENKFEEFPICSEEEDIIPEYYDVHPKLNEMFSFHSIEGLQETRWDDITKGAPENLIVYRRWGHMNPLICRDFKKRNNVISQKMRGKDLENK